MKSFGMRQPAAAILPLLVLAPSPAAASDSASEVVGTVVFGFLVMAALFLIFRKFVCWYWRQSEIVEILRQIRDGEVGDKDR